MQKIFRVIGEEWQQSRRRWAYESYYLSPGGQRSSPWGARLDYWGLRIFLWLGSLLLSHLAFSLDWGGAALLATVVTLGVHYSLKRSRVRRLSYLVAERRRQLARREVFREWMAMEPEQFAQYLAHLLQDLPGFGGIKVKDPEQEEGWLVATLEGKPALILGLLRGEKEEVGAREIRAFHRRAVRQGAETGLLVTTGKYTDEAVEWADKKAADLEIRLIDGEALLQQVEQKGLFPSLERIDALVEGEVHNPTPLAFYRQALHLQNLAGKKKSRAFAYTGLSLTMMAFFPGLQEFRYLYLAVAFLNFSLALWTWRPAAAKDKPGSSFLERPQS